MQTILTKIKMKQKIVVKLPVKKSNANVFSSSRIYTRRHTEKTSTLWLSKWAHILSSYTATELCSKLISVQKKCGAYSERPISPLVEEETPFPNK
jgi:hypothetical protein